MTDPTTALRNQNEYLHKVITQQAVIIDELIEAMQAGKCTLLPNVGDLTTDRG